MSKPIYYGLKEGKKVVPFVTHGPNPYVFSITGDKVEFLYKDGTLTSAVWSARDVKNYRWYAEMKNPFKSAPCFLRDAKGRFASRLTNDAEQYNKLATDGERTVFLDQLKGSYAVQVFFQAAAICD